MVEKPKSQERAIMREKPVSKERAREKQQRKERVAMSTNGLQLHSKEVQYV